ncbi:neural proliferation differentiation and control protein 1 [Suncus etruscus]|uniref:neural proliferation differentiation and control protein 1 n=1 Tax=Suncus etruscus TaxID=109475 RepID=UPI00210FC1BA|nr:neural proliferation differentiation and control protein 1 [Suncus etruscus]
MATPMPPPWPPLLRLLLPGLVLGAALRGSAAAAGLPDGSTCPRSLDCALQRRARCPPGAHMCGPCLDPFQEDGHGVCVPRPHWPPGDVPPQQHLEDEIDFLAQKLALQEDRHPQPAATLGLSKPSLPPTRGTPAPTSHSSQGPSKASGPVHMAPLRPGDHHGLGLVLVLILACSVAGAAVLAVAALCWCRLQRELRLTQKVDYVVPLAPGGPTAPSASPGDQRLARNAEMYHYQHQRQQLRCLQRHKEPPREPGAASSDEENEDGDFTVYECPGLAPTGEMEVRNPLFDHASLSAPLPGSTQ